MSHTCLVLAFMPKKGSFIQHNVTDGVIIGRFIWSWMSNSLLIFRVSTEPFVWVKTHSYITLYFRAKCLTHASILIKAECLKWNSHRSETVGDGWIAFSDRSIFSRTLVWYLNAELLQQRFFTPGWIYTLEYISCRWLGILFMKLKDYYDRGKLLQYERQLVCYDVFWCVNSIKAFADL